MAYSNGDLFHGDYRNGMRDGFGIYNSNIGDFFEGSFVIKAYKYNDLLGGWKNNLYHDFGALIKKDGTRIEGISFFLNKIYLHQP